MPCHSAEYDKMSTCAWVQKMKIYLLAVLCRRVTYPLKESLTQQVQVCQKSRSSSKDKHDDAVIFSITELELILLARKGQKVMSTSHLRSSLLYPCYCGLNPCLCFI